jgi:hypothetical protein
MNVNYWYDGLQRVDTFNEISSLPYGWTGTSGVTVSSNQMRIAGNSTWNVYANRTETVQSGQGAHIIFKVDITNPDANMYFTSGNWGTAGYRRWSLRLLNGNMYIRYYTGTTPTDIWLMALNTNTWYEAQLTLDVNQQFKVKVWQKSNPAISAQSTVTFTSGWSGLNWVFYAQPYSGILDIDEYREITWQYGTGRRTGMSDSSGWSAWTYDLRGRLTSERKTVTSVGTFLTRWGYNNGDLITWMEYPAGNNGLTGERVSYSYHPDQTSLKTMMSSIGNYYYLAQTLYDAAGRVRSMRLGAPDLATNPILLKEFNYYAWNNQAGRLQRIKAGMTGTPDSLLDLTYTYDPVGNITTISDYKMSPTQAQTFTYDYADRLLSASASGTNGSYSETYSYRDDGNLSVKAGLTYQYAASVTCAAGPRTIAHAVSSAGSNSYSYDCNGNMIQRNIGGSLYNLTYDAENRLTGVSGATAATFVYRCNGKSRGKKSCMANKFCQTAFYCGAPARRPGPCQGRGSRSWAAPFRRNAQRSGAPLIGWSEGRQLPARSGLACQDWKQARANSRARVGGEIRALATQPPLQTSGMAWRLECGSGTGFFLAPQRITFKCWPRPRRSSCWRAKAAEVCPVGRFFLPRE